MTNEAEATTTPPAVELPFQAEVQKVLALVIDSLYANKEVFLRELVSNASDALDKARFFQLTHADANKQEGEPCIEISVDEEAHTVTIADNGIGMTRDEVIEHLGTIAKSGSNAFLEQYSELIKGKQKDDALRLIGQFGVGFYSAFMVASRVDVSTRSMKAGSEPVIWRSTGSGTFTVLPGERSAPGTTITLHLKDEHKDYARAWRLKDVVNRYSDFVGFPILIDGERANQPVALWSLPKSQVTEEQHQHFFKHLTGGSGGDAPLLTIHFAVDAPVQFQALVYVPEKPPFDLFQKERTSLRLYAKRVLIIESCDRLTPVWLRFARGVVDSEDLSLNVSREMLQESRALSQIQSMIEKQVLKALKDLAESDPEKYARFWRMFGKVLKEGVSVDWKNKDAILELCRFESLKTPTGQLTSLTAYVQAMPEDQKDIYYLTGVGRQAVESSPHLEAFRKKGYDVLLLTDPIDEWVVQSSPEFDKRRLKSIAHGDVDLGESASDTADLQPALAAIKQALGARVKDVRFSKRLTDSASCLVSDEGDPGANMERIMRMMDERAQEKKRILEINPSHPVVKNLAALALKEMGSERINAFAETLYDQALLAEGVVEDPARLVRRLQDLLAEATRSAAAGT
ncbi:MAG: molecular chaperone HtpG [Polyangiaceae bacterium]|jgi:molecular chaperone HtpG|nr:molecular chaperone HtpG [Polyangiaceae bacterium]